MIVRIIARFPPWAIMAVKNAAANPTKVPVVGQFEIIRPLISAGMTFDDLYLDRRMGMMRA